MAEVKIVLNDAGIQELLHSAGVRAFLESKGRQVESIAAAGGGAYDVVTIEGAKRTRVVVYTGDYEARAAESEHQALSRAGHSVGGNPGSGG